MLLEFKLICLTSSKSWKILTYRLKVSQVQWIRSWEILSKILMKSLNFYNNSVEASLWTSKPRWEWSDKMQSLLLVNNSNNKSKLLTN